MLEGVLAVSARLAEADETDEILQAVCDGIQQALGFDKVAIELVEEEGAPLVPVAASGWPLDAAAINHGLPLEAVEPLFTSEFEVAGCYLIPPEAAEERLGPNGVSYRSEMNGRGPHAWARHWLLVPLEEPEGDRLGLIWVDDPRNRLLPTRARLAGPEAVRQPGGGRPTDGRPGRAPAPRGHPRPAHGAAEPARLPGPARAGGQPSAGRASP